MNSLQLFHFFFKHLHVHEINFNIIYTSISSSLSCLDYNTTFNWLSAATQHKDVDRLVFPDYLDFLLFVKDWRYKDFVSDSFVLTNAIRFPFQIGVAMAANAKNLTNVEDRFLHCMREEIYSQEKLVFVKLLIACSNYVKLVLV